MSGTRGSRYGTLAHGRNARGAQARTLVSHNVRLRIPFGHTLPQRRESRSAIGRWLLGVSDLHGVGDGAGQETHSWRRVLWLTGVDYFSTLGYQPGIALLAAGAVAPLATSVLVLVTLLGALPIYAQVARRSYAGQGSIAMLENLLPGWSGKLLVLILLGFAATDFVITMTLSAADATKHAIENPYLHPFLGDAQIGVTLILLALLAVVFLSGFRGAIGMAAVVAIPYLGLSLVVLGRGLGEIAARPELWSDWHRALMARGDWGTITAGALLVFPKLALGMSGFETGVSVMPLIDGGSSDAKARRGVQLPLGRIRRTRKLLVAAAAIMSGMLVLSSVVTTLLISPDDYREGGPASGRALAHLAHGFFNAGFASIYDIWTILILWLAGASAMAGLLNLVPRYLPRFGMAPAWAVRARPLVLVLFVINVVVTLVFRASVEAQSAAYATGVLALILSAALAVTLALWREERRPASVYFGAMTLVFAYTLVDNCVERPDGVIIGSAFILLVLVVSTVSRSVRATELRVSEADFVDQASAELGPLLVGKQVHMVPMKARSPEARAGKAAEIRRYYRIDEPLAFVHVNLLDNRSEFLAPLRVEVRREGPDYVIEVHGAIAIANTIAYLSEMVDPISIFLSLTREDLTRQAFRFLFFGEGETGLLVYAILLRYWGSTAEDDVRPRIHLLSD
jgi:hypothetical protein